MTLKEKVAEVIPEHIDNLCEGGVFGCPDDYSFLNTGSTCCDDGCDKCWNREYKEVPDEV